MAGVRRRTLTALLGLALVAALALVAPAGALAQEDPPSTGVPTQDIIPRPNTGHEPVDAGDRGGALQLLLPALLVLAIGGATLHLTRQARRAKASGPSQP
jgi:hypothetical protein